MSPRRMDISSLLRDPSPPNDPPVRHPRSIDALCNPEPLPASIQSILNTPRLPPRPPFGLDALVHVATEERRRITALTSPQDTHHAAHYAYPPPYTSPYKRPRDSPPRSPSPDSRFSQHSSPSTRLHSSASPINNYPALRRQPPFDPTPSRPAPSPLFSNDSRSIALQHTSPYLLPHSSPRDISPLHHSPQLSRPQPFSFPVSQHTESDIMSPRYGHGPKMAGGIEVFSNDAPSSRDAYLSNYQSPGRDMSVERRLSDSRPEYPRHELPNLSPLSVRPFPPLNHSDHFPYQVEGQEGVLLRDHPRFRPHLPPGATTDNSKYTQAGQPSSHPIRVWEDQPIVREIPRHVSPVLSLGIINPAEGQSQQPVREDWRAEFQQHVSENVPMPQLSTSNEPQLHSPPVSKRLAFDSSTYSGNSLEPPPLSPQPRSVHQAHVLQSLPQDSSTSCAPALDSHPGIKYEPELPDTRVDASTNALLVSSDSIIAEPSLGKACQMPGPTDANDITVNDPLLRQSPSRLIAQPIPDKESGISVPLTTVSQGTSRSPSQQAISVPSPVKADRSASLADMLVSAPVPPETPHKSPEPENATAQILPASEQFMMDVEEELLSLVEDRPIPTSSKIRAGSKSLQSTVVDRGTSVGASQRSNGASDGPTLVPSSHIVPKGTHLVTDKDKDRASMPPPAVRSKKSEKDKAAPTTSVATGSKKKKDGTSKPTAKLKQPPKPRAKPAPKPKAKVNVVDSSLKGNSLKGTVNVNARSRSTSVIPSAVDNVVPEPDVDNSDKEDDKLYCVCKTQYDEDRMMIACDRCDEWFHTLCVNMPDLEIDLVDQFICPPCIQKHPHLRTTWKRRCLFGLQHENPSSPEACHKPSRGAFSKYCSDDCGIKYMQAHIAQWEKSGGARDMLWDSVKNAMKREGVVVPVTVKTDESSSPRAMDIDNSNSAPKVLDSAAKRRAEREITRLNVRLEELVKERELMKRELDIVVWREKVVELASERAGRVDECGWDQRLCFGEEEWADFGPEVLESYEDARVKTESEQDAMPLDIPDTAREEWWCTGKKKCERHAGWQKLRAAEVSFDKETKEGILLKLTTREREIRKNIEDILYPQPSGTLQVPSKVPHPEVQLNGLGKRRDAESE